MEREEKNHKGKEFLIEIHSIRNTNGQIKHLVVRARESFQKRIK